jgi:hypothetical protein
VPNDSRTAWLLIRYLDVASNSPPKLIDVGIFSEPTPTARMHEFYACLLEMSAPTYHEACNAIVERCHLWQHLRWVLMFVKPLGPARAPR